jgi:predicted metal-dependent hydrolase
MSEQDYYDPRYLKYFECFNQQRFFEAHDVLEALWLPQRQGPNGSFYKGLIQLAGAFVHWQKQRPGPAVALFKLARTYLQQYPAIHEGLSVMNVLLQTDEWLRQLTAVPSGAELPAPAATPQLRLE